MVLNVSLAIGESSFSKLIFSEIVLTRNDEFLTYGAVLACGGTVMAFDETDDTFAMSRRIRLLLSDRLGVSLLKEEESWRFLEGDAISWPGL